MKRVVAIVQPSKLEEVENALRKLGIFGINLTEVMGFGHQKEPVEFYRDAENPVSFVPKIKVEIVVPTGLVDKAIDGQLLEGARSPNPSMASAGQMH
jgi:nitrogen regulatory protein PII